MRSIGSGVIRYLNVGLIDSYLDYDPVVVQYYNLYLAILGAYPHSVARLGETQYLILYYPVRNYVEFKIDIDDDYQ